MSVGREGGGSASRDDDEHSECGDRPAAAVPTNQPFDERRTSGLLRAVGHALASWASTTRLIAIVCATLVVVFLGVWLFQLRIEIGPVHVTGR